jgi:TfoX/Sxy family transcriptional regulator of competence genes
VPVSPGYREYVSAQIGAVKPVVTRAMFGGVGLYVEGWFVGLIDDDVLYFRVDNDNLKDYLKAGMEPFRPFGEGTKPMRYYEVPAEVLESPFELAIWLDKSLEAARDPRARTRPKSPRGGGRRRLPGLLLLASLGAGPAVAQAGTDIFLVPLTRTEDRLVLGTATNLTARPGYDNQPSFTPDNRSLLFSSAREGGRTDIFRIELGTRQVRQVTRTPENEYSPTVTPDGSGFTVIFDSTQFLARYDPDGTNRRNIFDRLGLIGYHAWLDAGTVVLFVLGSPATLQLADARTGQALTLAWDIGRSLHRIPGRTTGSYAQRMSDGLQYLMELDPATRTVRPLVRALEGSQDHAWTPWGSVLMARGNAIYEWRPAAGAAWRQVGRFDDPALARLSRLAVSPDGSWLAVVADEPRVAPDDGRP